jgi:hypothetical protein
MGGSNDLRQASRFHNKTVGDEMMKLSFALLSFTTVVTLAYPAVAQYATQAETVCTTDYNTGVTRCDQQPSPFQQQYSSPAPHQQQYQQAQPWQQPQQPQPWQQAMPQGFGPQTTCTTDYNTGVTRCN